MDKKIIVALGITGFLLLSALLIFPFAGLEVSAQEPATDSELSGWAWSSNIGWISFSSKNILSADVEYGVKRNLTSGALSGYAWSSNIGWIKFDPSPTFTGPDIPENDTRYGAKLVGDSLDGWARACSVFISGCSEPLRPDSERGGWDGWIRMENVTLDENQGYQGFAWGDLNLGWIKLGLTDRYDDGIKPPPDICDPNIQICDDGGGTCNSEEECCQGDTWLDNPNCPSPVTVTVLINGSCLIDGNGDSYSPQFAGEQSVLGDPCSGDPAPENCRVFPVGDNITVSFSQLEDGAVDWQSGICDEENLSGNTCEIHNVTESVNITANCPTGDVSDCRIQLAPGSDRIELVEDRDFDYTAGVLSDTYATIGLYEQNTTNECENVSYGFEATVSGLSDVKIVCNGTGGYTEDNCSNGNLTEQTRIKAKFFSIPESSPLFGQVTFTSIVEGQETSLSTVYNKFIKFSRVGGN